MLFVAILAIVPLLATVVGATGATPPRGPAYWLVGSDGGVFTFGDAAFAGSVANHPLNAPVVGLAATSAGTGYWMAAADGGVFAFGDARFEGSAAHHLNAPIVGIAPTPSGNGYWLAAADGGVFAYGDATFAGAAAHGRLNAPIVGIAATPSGNGYWLVAADGGVFTFGDATFAGAVSRKQLNAPIVGIAASPSGNGYLLAAADGGVFSFGDGKFAGSAAHHRLNAPIVSIARTWDGRGYWLASRDGGVFSFGDAGYYGSSVGQSLRGPIAAVAAGLAPDRPAAATGLIGTHGYDISWPQCGSPYPANVSFGIVGVTGGKAFTANPCLASEAQWSHANGQAAGVYLNINAPDASDVADPAYPARTGQGPEGRCGAADAGCQMANFGAHAVDAAWATAAGQGVTAPLWWLDVETSNTWSADPAINRRIIVGAVQALKRRGASVGVYSTSYQWTTITGGLQLGLPVWVAGAPDAASAPSWCDGRASFNGGPTWLVQALPTAYDDDAACGPVLAAGAGAFRTTPRDRVPVVAPGSPPGGRVG